MKYIEEITGDYESVMTTLERLEPKEEHKIKLGKDIQFKAVGLIKLNFKKDYNATVTFEFDNPKPF